MGKTEITIEIDDAKLGTYSDERLALCWSIAQANSADGFEHSGPGDLAERIGREIIRRWLSKAPVELYSHQGRHYYQHQLSKLAKFEPGPGENGSPDWHDGTWVSRTATPTTEECDVQPTADH